MKNIMTHAAKLFSRNKGFFYIITIQPIFVFLLMSFLLPYTTKHQIAFIGSNTARSMHIQKALTDLEGIELIQIREEEINSKLSSGNIELAVIMDRHGQIQLRSLGRSEIEGAVVLCLEQSMSENNVQNRINVNYAPNRGRPISNSLGFMIYKTLAAGNVLAALIINERKRKMKDRILLSGKKTSVYLGGVSLIYLFFMLIGSLVYYLAALVLKFDFGMRNSLSFLAVLFAANVFSTALFLFASTVFNKEESLWFLATFILTPMGLFSGILFPYRFMPPMMQTIGSFFPHRWIAHAIEVIQKTGNMSDAIWELGLILAASVILFIAASMRSSLNYQSSR